MNRIVLLALLLLVLAGCHRQATPKGRPQPDMRPSFSITDKNPLGLYIAYHTVETVFTGYLPEQNKKSFDSYFKDFTQYDASRKGNVFCVLAKQFYPNEDDVEAIADYVSNGNTLVVAANDFSDVFLDKFHLKTEDTYLLQEAMRYGSEEMNETSLAMYDTAAFGSQVYHYFFYPLQAQVYREASYPAQRITSNASGRSGAVVFKYGSGRIIAAVNATAFTNYFLLTRSNYKHLQHLLSYVPEEINGLTWDSYYNKTESQRGNKNNGGESFSAFGELMKQEALRWAFWLTLLLAATWIINGIIRRQRPIAVVKSNANTSVEFAETIGRLYLLKKDNKNIAAKMITYFLEQVRSRYYISTGRLDERFVELLSAKSGQPVSETERLLKTFDRINVRDRIDDMELLDLNTQLRQFLS